MTYQTQRGRDPIVSALDVVGDRWSLLIVRTLASGPRFFGELSTSQPNLGIGDLAGVLARLQGAGCITVEWDTHDRQRTVYALTERGRGLLPVMRELAMWAEEHLPDAAASPELARLLSIDL